MTDSPEFVRLMREGTGLHRAGQPERALVCFERAFDLQPDSTNAASACATMLTGMGQPQAAYAVLQRVQKALLQDSDGATNLGIAAEACGQMQQAQAAYRRALEIDPDNPRALNNTALLLAQQGDFDTAIARLERCAALSPKDPATWCNLADTLIAARRFGQARQLLGQAILDIPDGDALAVRHCMALAFDGQIEMAQAAIAALSGQRRQHFQDLLRRANTATTPHLSRQPERVPDAQDLFCQQAFEAMADCDWRDDVRVTAVLREMLARSARTGQVRDWRDAQFFGLLLPIMEDEMLQIRRISMDGIAGQLRTPMAPFQAPRGAARDGRIHVGLACADLRDARVVNALERQLALHDHTRFALHVYASTPRSHPALTSRWEAFGVPLVEIGHMSNDEAVGRIRLDALDVFVDAAFNTPWCRPEIVERRVAPVQIRQVTWHRHHPPRQCDYNVSDVFVHPPELDLEPYGPIVRLPHTCWLATDDSPADAGGASRAELGWPVSAPVLCCLVPPLMVDRASFGLWMQLLAALPDAILCLPSYPARSRANLAAAAHAAGVDAARICHLPSGSRAQTLARIQCADLFIDTLRFNANHGLVDALRMGVPALSCAGSSMASRLGGSVIRAAGLPDCVVSKPAALVEAALRLCRTPGALAQLRARLGTARVQAPLFDAPARLREWEWAWSVMVERHRNGQPPAAFDVPSRADAATAPLRP